MDENSLNPWEFSPREQLLEELEAEAELDRLIEKENKDEN